MKLNTVQYGCTGAVLEREKVSQFYNLTRHEHSLLKKKTTNQYVSLFFRKKMCTLVDEA
jgi:hypothetical protein